MLFPLAEASRLELLMTYTLFHLGLYSTIFVACVSYHKKGNWPAGAVLCVACLCLVIAGFTGGTIAANIPEFERWESFSSEPLKCFGGIDSLSYTVFARIEHGAFWIGVLFVLMFVGLSQQASADSSQGTSTTKK